MANISKAITQNLLDSLLPTFGKPRKNIPTWDEGQKMFIFDQHVSDRGNLSYRGIRFCDRVVVVEKVGLFHSWTYINSIELFAFNDDQLELLQKRDYDKVFRNEEFVRKETVAMIKDYLASAFKSQHVKVAEADIERHALQLVEGCYKSFLDSSFDTRLTKIIPQIENQ